MAAVDALHSGGCDTPPQEEGFGERGFRATCIVCVPSLGPCWLSGSHSHAFPFAPTLISGK